MRLPSAPTEIQQPFLPYEPVSTKACFQSFFSSVALGGPFGELIPVPCLFAFTMVGFWPLHSPVPCSRPFHSFVSGSTLSQLFWDSPLRWCTLSAPAFPGFSQVPTPVLLLAEGSGALGFSYITHSLLFLCHTLAMLLPTPLAVLDYITF